MESLLTDDRKESDDENPGQSDLFFGWFDFIPTRTSLDKETYIIRSREVGSGNRHAEQENRKRKSKRI